MTLSTPEPNLDSHYRESDLARLGEHISRRQSVEVIGMKRVGIGSMLSHFLEHEELYSKYIRNHARQLFVQIDLNELIERELLAFWRLTLKRIVDAGERTGSDTLIDLLRREFRNAIQSDDLFLTVEAVRTSLRAIHQDDWLPTLFFLRFDRMDHLFTPDFQNNLAALNGVCDNELVFVLTGHRRLSHLSSETYTATDFLPFMKTQFIKPADVTSAGIVLDSLSARTGLALSPRTRSQIMQLSGGHIMYLRLLFILYTEHGGLTRSVYSNDERILLQSEELTRHLNRIETGILKKILEEETVSDEERSQGSYLWESGILTQTDMIFSPLLALHLPRLLESGSERSSKPFTRKENDLFNLLKDAMPEIVTRETVASQVWPEYRAFGVSDWTIDRLVSRVRKKLQDRNSPYIIETIRTRGFRLAGTQTDAPADQPLIP
ncbi:MAG: transcriptional regulatory protein YedW [candidate division WS6 bacterium OLB20]|uniref:Transcriptional regulatory protein YedW n=1 Tax=candidate division WS6 bacterium OLB20 TaxID=1617426 RepID=A0A136M061_9BACT|nr:MAG: transcriptional regulatory protein YedW [candidate division WS6 bacterium OLB20]